MNRPIGLSKTQICDRIQNKKYLENFVIIDLKKHNFKFQRMLGWTSNPYKVVLFHEKQGDDHFFYMCSLAQKELVKNIQVNF